MTTWTKPGLVRNPYMKVSFNFLARGCKYMTTWTKPGLVDHGGSFLCCHHCELYECNGYHYHDYGGCERLSWSYGIVRLTND